MKKAVLSAAFCALLLCCSTGHAFEAFLLDPAVVAAANGTKAVTIATPVRPKLSVIGVVKKFFVQRDRKIRKGQGIRSFIQVAVEERVEQRAQLLASND